MSCKTKFSTNLEVLKQEVEITFYKSSGPGGQRKNKRETAVRLFHPPSGITVIATKHRSQAKNRELAFKTLQSRLKDLNREKKPRKTTKIPKSVKEKILKNKKKQATIKKLRKKIHNSDDENPG